MPRMLRALYLFAALSPLLLSAQAADEATQTSNSAWLNNEATPTAIPTADSSAASKIIKDDGTPLRLGFVNLRRVMANIPQLANLRARLDSEFAQQKDSLEQQNNEIQRMEKELSAMPRGDAYSELEKQVIAKRRTFARLDASFRDAYSVRRNEELATLQQQVVDEIVGLAKDEGYDVILNDIGVIYVSGTADLSTLVIERLQKQVKQGENGG